jgi:nitroreductase
VDTWEAINGVRVIRDFADRPLAPEHLKRILNAARRTGSSRNQQLWAFVVVRDRDHLHELTGVGRYADHVAGAAAAVALVAPLPGSPGGESILWDLGRAAQDMILAAWELGIGSAPATVFDHDLAARSLGLPEDQRCYYVLSFGYPADPSALTRENRRGGRASLADVVHEERWNPPPGQR